VIDWPSDPTDVTCVVSCTPRDWATYPRFPPAVELSSPVPLCRVFAVDRISRRSHDAQVLFRSLVSLVRDEHPVSPTHVTHDSKQRVGIIVGIAAPRLTIGRGIDLANVRVSRQQTSDLLGLKPTTDSRLFALPGDPVLRDDIGSGVGLHLGSAH
jgi:hypothetical protein